MISLANKNILISGAAEGIGKETAILLSKLGARLILLDLNASGLKEALSELDGVGHLSVSYNLAKLDGIETEVKEIISLCGPLDGFVHCVGIRSRRPLVMITPKILSEVMSLNFGSFVELIRCITKKNNYNYGLSIVGISSISSQRGGTSVTAYAASKAAMDCAVRCLAKELSNKQIRLNTVAPAQINTPAYANLLKIKGISEDLDISRQYLGLGEPIDVAHAIAFLLSPASGFITGSTIPVDGGFLSA